MDRRDQDWFQRELEDIEEEKLTWETMEDSMLEIDQALKNLPKVTPPHSITDQMWAKLPPEETSFQPRWQRKSWIWGGSVAAILALTWLGSYLYWGGSTKSVQLKDQATMSSASESTSQKMVQPLSALSPDGKYLATWEEDRLHVRDLEGKQLFTSDAHPQLVEIKQLVWKGTNHVEIAGIDSSVKEDKIRDVQLKKILIEIPMLRR